MRVIQPPIKTLKEYHSLIEYWSRVGFNQLKLIPYSELSVRLREEICSKMGLRTTLPVTADLGTIQDALSDLTPTKDLNANIKCMAGHYDTYVKHQECADPISLMVFFLRVGDPVLAIFIGSEWNILYDER